MKGVAGCEEPRQNNHLARYSLEQSFLRLIVLVFWPMFSQQQLGKKRKQPKKNPKVHKYKTTDKIGNQLTST